MPADKPFTTTEAALAAAVTTIELLQDSAHAAVLYSDAYEGTCRTVVFDGSAYAPAHRILPGAGVAWRLTADDPEAWEAYYSYVDQKIDEITVPDPGSDDNDPGNWTLGWEEGVLYAYSPDYCADEDVQDS